MTKLLHRAQRCYPHPAGAYWVPRRLGGGAPSLAEAAQRGRRGRGAGRHPLRTPFGL